MKTEVIRHELYNGAVKIDFLPNSHTYKKETGERITSVTSALGIIAKPALIYWSANLCAEFLQEQLKEGQNITTELIEQARVQHTLNKVKAASIGHLVHSWCEEFIKTGNKTIPDDDRVKNGVLAFLRWVDEHGVQFVSSERIVYSRRHDFVGIMDAEAIIDGKRVVVDFKTSNGIYEEYHLQTAAYQRAAEEEGSKYEGDRLIVQFGKEDVFDKQGNQTGFAGEFKAVSCGDLENDYQAFLSALHLKEHLKQKSSS